MRVYWRSKMAPRLLRIRFMTNSPNGSRKWIAQCPRTGAHLRAATGAEIAAYEAQDVRHPAFRRPVLVGAVLVDEWTGYGVWFGGAGF